MTTKFRRLLLPAIGFVFVFCVAAAAQQTAERKTQTTFPSLPFFAEYEYQPYFFAQWIADHPQYSRIEAILDDLDKPTVIKLVLIEKESGKRVYYCSAANEAKTLAADGKEAHAAAIDFKIAPAIERQPTYGFAFRDRRGQPILWRVTPATKPSERGRQLVPAAAAPGLLLDYRELATAAGAGTAVQIGDRVIEAEPWTEISAPPYFVAYRGTVAVGRHWGGLPLGAQNWRVVARPAELKNGAEWTLSDDGKRQRIFKIVHSNNGELVIGEQGARPALTSFTVHRTKAGDFVLRSARLVSNSQTMEIRFEPELPLGAPAAGKFETTFAVSQGKYDKIVTGAVSAERAGGDLRLRWQPRAPEWTKSRTLETIVKFAPDSYQLETTQPEK